jgi:solute:Na+ symporter, SSS family
MNHTLFLVTFLAYLLATLAFGVWISRHHRSSGEDFLLGGRRVSPLLTIGSTVGTMVGTGSSMGAVGYAYANGWAGALYGIGGALGILALAQWFAPARAQRFATMSQELAHYVDDNPLVARLVAVLTYIACVGWLGAQILGGGVYLAWMAGIDLPLAKLLVAIGFGAYCVIGGYVAVAWTDTLQALIVFCGFILMAVYVLARIGGVGALGEGLDPAAASLLGWRRIGALPALSLVCVIAVGVLASPAFRQRIYAARSVCAVRRSFLLTGGLYLLFSAIPAMVGVAARQLVPGLADPSFAFPSLATDVLPLALGLVLLVAGLSATMSSASSDAIAGVAVLTRDLYAMVCGRPLAEHRTVAASRVGLVATIALALLLALLSNDIIGYIGTMIATVMSGLCVCALLGRFWRRFTWQGAVACLLCGSLVSIAVGTQPAWNAFWGNPCIPGLAAAFTAGIVTSLVGPARRRHAAPLPHPSPD